MLTVPLGALGADAPPQFLEEQVAVFMNVLEKSGVEGPSLADDLRYQEFLAAGAKPGLPVRSAGWGFVCREQPRLEKFTVLTASQHHAFWQREVYIDTA